MSIEESKFSVFIFCYLSIEQIPCWLAKMETKVPRVGQKKTQQQKIVLAKDVYLNSVQLRLQAYWLTPQKIFWQITSRTEDGLPEDPSVTLKLIAIYGNALSPLNHQMVSLLGPLFPNLEIWPHQFLQFLYFVHKYGPARSIWLTWRGLEIKCYPWEFLQKTPLRCFLCIINKRIDCKPMTKTAEQRIRFYN